jgi:hypothetical protein
MCDYSLQGVSTVPAKVGHKLVTTGFHNTPTRGFTAIGTADVAVCLLPGTELSFEREVCREQSLWFRLLKKSQPLVHKVARFRQINLDDPCAHHDALEFPDGQVVLLTYLQIGQKATVIQLPAHPKTAAGSEAQNQLSRPIGR